jgi:hypothetical protein
MHMCVQMLAYAIRNAPAGLCWWFRLHCMQQCLCYTCCLAHQIPILRVGAHHAVVAIAPAAGDTHDRQQCCHQQTSTGTGCNLGPGAPLRLCRFKGDKSTFIPFISPEMLGLPQQVLSMLNAMPRHIHTPFLPQLMKRTYMHFELALTYVLSRLLVARCHGDRFLLLLIRRMCCCCVTRVPVLLTRQVCEVYDWGSAVVAACQQDQKLVM